MLTKHLHRLRGEVNQAELPNTGVVDGGHPEFVLLTWSEVLQVGFVLFNSSCANSGKGWQFQGDN